MNMRYSVAGLLLLGVLGSLALEFSRDQFNGRQRIVEKQRNAKRKVPVIPKSVKRRADNGETEEDEVVDMRLERMSQGRMRLEFKSHGRNHKLMLEESRIQLANVPIQLLGSHASRLPEVKDSLKNIKMMRDPMYDATIAVKVDTDNEMEAVLESGVFTFGYHEFNIARETHSTGRVRKRSIEHGSALKIRVAPAKESPPVEFSMGAIDPIQATVELVVIADFGLFNKILPPPEVKVDNKMPAMPEVDPYTGLYLFVAHIVNMMDVAYSTMKNDDIMITVDLAGIVVFSNPSYLPFLVEDHTVIVDGEKLVEGFDAHSALTDWLAINDTSFLPPFDHLMLLTGYNMYDSFDGSTGLLGLAWLSSICHSYLSVSMVEASGLMSEIGVTAAHELGHSLGSDHETVGASSECPEDNFIMASAAFLDFSLANKFLFSCCSQRAFYITIRNVMCLNKTTAIPNYPSHVDTLVASQLPGQKYAADDQCFFAFGTSACPTQDHNICLHLMCTNPVAGEPCLDTFMAAADGTICDTNKWCYRGECVDVNTIYSIPDQNCNVRDCYGIERRCKDGVNVFRPARFLCYPEFFNCDEIQDCSDNSDEVGCNVPTPICGGALTGKNGSILAPNYPMNYPNWADCVWSITVRRLAVVSIEFKGDSMIEYDSTCSLDSIQVYDGNTVIADLCGTIQSGSRFRSKSNTMGIIFLTDGSINYPGWKIKWKEICKDKTGSPKCPNIYNRCLNAATALEKKKCKRRCRKFGKRCCQTCCLLFPQMCE